MITTITVMGIIEVATVIHITMTIIDTKITISITRRLRHLPEGEAGSLNRWVAFFNGSKVVSVTESLLLSLVFICMYVCVSVCTYIYVYVCIHIYIYTHISSNLTVAQCSRMYPKLHYIIHFSLSNNLLILSFNSECVLTSYFIDIRIRSERHESILFKKCSTVQIHIRTYFLYQRHVCYLS